ELWLRTMISGIYRPSRASTSSLFPYAGLYYPTASAPAVWWTKRADFNGRRMNSTRWHRYGVPYDQATPERQHFTRSLMESAHQLHDFRRKDTGNSPTL